MTSALEISARGIRVATVLLSPLYPLHPFFAAVLVPFIMGFVADAVGIKNSFYVCGGFLILCCIIVALFIRRIPGFKTCSPLFLEIPRYGQIMINQPFVRHIMSAHLIVHGTMGSVFCGLTPIPFKAFGRRPPTIFIIQAKGVADLVPIGVIGCHG